MESWTDVRESTFTYLNQSSKVAQLYIEGVDEQSLLERRRIALESARDAETEAAVRQLVASSRRKLRRIGTMMQGARTALTNTSNQLQTMLINFSGTRAMITRLGGEDMSAIELAKTFGGIRLRFRMGKSSPMQLHLRRELERMSEGAILNFAPRHVYELTAAGMFRIIR